MKKILLAASALCFFLACNEADTIFKTVEQEKLAPPLGLRSVTQDRQVTLFWYTSNYEKDFGGYFVFMATGNYTHLSSDSSINTSVFTKVDSVSFSGPSDEVISRQIKGLTNGTTYSFVVVSYNKKDKSKISYPSNIVADTPRPEVQTVILKSASTNDVKGDDSQAGFDFGTLQVVAVPATGYTGGEADIINEAFDPSASKQNIRPWIAGMNGAGVQDLGYMDSLDETDIAPEQGYSEPGKSIAVLLGHVYAIKTGDNHYGKILITRIGDASNNYEIEFNAAVQLKTGDRNYKTSNFLYQLGIH